MPFLLIAGNKFARDLESEQALAVRVPLEGGFEGRYQRRVRAMGYESLHLSARGLGDLTAYLTDVHGVRPPHLGKKNVGQAAVGERYFIPPVVAYRLEQLPPTSKGIVLWLIEGHVLSNQELAYLVDLAASEPRLKIVVEVGGDREFTWMPLGQTLA
ncbi:MAG: NAD(P)H-quinone oxidoreductase subunit N [Cyanobacteria bacterium J06635_1]